MSEVRRDVDLSAIFSDDDSEMRRFVDFIQQRRGGVGKQKFLFMNCEADRWSFEDQLENLPTPQFKEVKKHSQLSASCLAAAKEKNTVRNEIEVNVSEVSNSITTDNLGLTKQQHLLPKAASTVQKTNNTNISRMRCEKAKSSPIGKSRGVISPNDRLRRLSIKNNSAKKLAGRRTLLQEFESTIEGITFNPATCSTPITQPVQYNPQLSSNTNPLTETGHIGLNNENNPNFSKPCCEHSDTLIRTLHRKEAELKNYVGNILDKSLKQVENQSRMVQKSSRDNEILNRSNNCTSLKRTFTVEKGNGPGQLILTPDGGNKQYKWNLNSPNQKRESRANLSSCHQNCKSTAQESVHQVSLGSMSKRGVSKILQTGCLNKKAQLEAELQKTLNENCKTPNSPEKPTNEKDHSLLLICSSKEQNVLVMPVNQTVNKSAIQENDNVISSKIPEIETYSSAAQAQGFEQPEDNLKLTDILTDDEGDTPILTLRSASEVPLNLAPNSYSLERKHRPKRTSLKKKLRQNNTLQLNSEIVVGNSPRDHSTKQIYRKKREPLNRPPGIPINGENYAQELARMSNYEILDLRKRNSLDRWSKLSLEEFNKKHSQLDYHIEKEISRRKLDDIIQIQICQSDQENIEGEILPVPYNFRDSLTAQQEGQNILKDSTFIGEKSSDRTKFKNNEKKSPSGTREILPKILKQYLEVSQRYLKRKPRKCTSKRSTRSLFNTQSLYEFDELNISAEKLSSGEKTAYSRLKKLSIPHLKSPPNTQNNLGTAPKVISPPPDISTGELQNTPYKLHSDVVDIVTASGEIQNSPHADKAAVGTTTGEIRNTPNEIYTDVDKNFTLPPPPPGFESDSNNANTYTTNVTVEVGPTNTNIDDHLPKEPAKPDAKRKTKKIDSESCKTQESTADNQNLIHNSNDSTACGSVRRSKRGRVPLRQPIILSILHEQVNQKMEKISKAKERKKRNDLKKQRNEKKNLKISSKRAESALPTIPENDDAQSFYGGQGSNLVKKAKSTTIKNKHTNKVIRSRKEHLSSSDNVQCSRLILNSPPPIEHLNNVFDHLRETSLSSNAALPATPQQFKSKPFKTLVRREKPSETPANVDNTCVSTTSTCINKNSNIELSTWLKNMDDINSTDRQTAEIFKDMRISSATNLCFTELQGVEYAFYDTAEKASLGYLRFKPHQIKPKKKAKRFDLQFINFAGLFRITINNSDSILGLGDMITIEKLAYYDIENVTDDIGILMVIKK